MQLIELEGPMHNDEDINTEMNSNMSAHGQTTEKAFAASCFGFILHMNREQCNSIPTMSAETTLMAAYKVPYTEVIVIAVRQVRLVGVA